MVVGGLTLSLSYYLVLVLLLVGGRGIAPLIFYLVVVVGGLTSGLSYSGVLLVVGGRGLHLLFSYSVVVVVV